MKKTQTKPKIHQAAKPKTQTKEQLAKTPKKPAGKKSSPQSVKTPEKSSTKGKGKVPPQKPKITPVKGKDKGKKVEPKKSVNSFTLTSKNITVNIGGVTKMISATHANFKKVVGLVKSKHWSEAAKFLDMKVIVEKAIKGSQKILEKIKGKTEAEKDTRMGDKAIRDLKQGVTTDYEAFFERCKANPNPGSIDQLFDFLKYIRAVIQDDGTFFAYKYVRNDYMDCYSRKYDNHPGNVVKMPRDKVTYDPHEACSAGLHVGAKEYMGSGGGKKIMIVQVDPANVVSVPKDYHGQKMRVCEYKVIREVRLKDIA